MAVEGVDYSWGRPNLAELYRLGKRFIIRYVSYSTTGKNLTRGEAERATAAGLAIVTNWENAAGDQLGGFARGVTHAKEADRLHKACGGPPGRPIYFSTDFDASTSQLATCYDYLRGAASVIGWARVGVYGGLRTISYMKGKGVRWLWQTYAWSGGRWASGTHLQQYRNGVRLAGADTDLNRAMQADYGQWMVGKVPPGVEDDVSWTEQLPLPKFAIDKWGDWKDGKASAAGLLASGYAHSRSGNEAAHQALRETRAGFAAVLAAQAGGDVAEAVRAELDRAAEAERAERAAELTALRAEIGDRLDAAETERTELTELVRQGQSGELDAAEVVRLIGEKLTAAATEGGA